MISAHKVIEINFDLLYFLRFIFLSVTKVMIDLKSLVSRLNGTLAKCNYKDHWPLRSRLRYIYVCTTNLNLVQIVDEGNGRGYKVYV